LKECSVCKELKSLEEYYSYKKTRKKDGESYFYYPPYCKSCAIKKTRQNREGKDYEEYKRVRREYMRERAGTEERKIRDRKNAKKRRAEGHYKKWQQDNPDKLKQYRINKMNATHNISKTEWSNCKDYFNNECAYCGKHIDNHYVTWNGKLKKTDFHKEHVDHLGKNDLSNCIPSCKDCNSSKWTFTFEEWYSKENKDYNYFSQERLDKINKWLKEDYKKYIELNVGSVK
jgi:hypothetical protein